MSNVTDVIRALEAVNCKNIESKNRRWLGENARKLNLIVIVGDCTANTFDIAEEWDNEGTMLIQEGKTVQFKDDFHPGKEAFLLVKNNVGYCTYRYYPKE